MRQTSLFALLVAALLAASAQAQVGSPGIEYGNAIQTQVGSPGIEYGNTIAAGDGVQLYPYDQQDPWLHGHFQRVPSYGGFSSFRPYNYRHVSAQTQLAQTWGHAHGMPYSQQFWNRYRGSYLQGNLHAESQPMRPHPQAPGHPSQMDPRPAVPQQPYPQQPYPQQPYPTQGNLNPGSLNNAYPVSAVRSIGYQTLDVNAQPAYAVESANNSVSAERPIHILPQRMTHR